MTNTDGPAGKGHQYGPAYFYGNSAGILGDVVNHHHHYYSNTERGPAAISLHPSCRIPFRKDRDFVERSPFHEIYQCATQPAARVGVVGLGGVGKTQLAIECAYRRGAAKPQTWVFWVHASSVARFEQSYRQIAEQVHLAGWADPKQDVLTMVYSWLCDENNGAWTMVLDNADDCDVVLGPGSQATRTTPMSSTLPSDVLSNQRSVAKYLPSCDHGSIMITSRSREVVEGLIEYAEDIFEVKPMVEEDAIALLKKKLKKLELDDDRTALSQLVHQLDCMPLAITQAAAYINQPGPKMTVSKYAEQLLQGDEDRDRLLAKGLRDPRRDGEASNSIIVTWHASFERIRQTRISAARLLSLMSLFDREGIPKQLLQGRYLSSWRAYLDPQGQYLSSWRSELELQQESTYAVEENDFEGDVEMLYAYSLVTIDTSQASFEMHRLVQHSMRKWLELHDEAIYWRERYINIFEIVFPTGDHSNWPTCLSLFPHLEQVLGYRVFDENHMKQRAIITYRGAWYAWQAGQYQIAKQMAEASLSDRENVPFENSIPVLNGMYMLALVLRAQGKYDKAEELNRRVLAGRVKELGMNHSDTLTGIDNLAGVLRDQGKYNEAEGLQRQALAGREKKLGTSDSDTLTSVSNLALVLRDQAKYSEAEELCRRALTGREKELGTTHPDTVTAVSHLATVLRGRRKYGEAEALERRSLAGHEKVLGVNHPYTLVGVSNLAGILRDQEKYSEAEKLHRQALMGNEKTLGVNHPITLASMSNLAIALEEQGKYSEAEELSRRALAGLEKELGMSHPNTISSVYNLAHLQHIQKAFEEALQLYNRAVEGFTQIWGKSHRYTLACQQHRDLLLHHMKLSALARNE